MFSLKRAVSQRRFSSEDSTIFSGDDFKDTGFFNALPVPYRAVTALLRVYRLVMFSGLGE